MASTLSPSEAERRDLYNLANNVPFDDRVHHGAEVDDLNITLIKGYLREVGSSLYAEADTMDFVELCQRMDIVQGPQGIPEAEKRRALVLRVGAGTLFPLCAHRYR